MSGIGILRDKANKLWVDQVLIKAPKLEIVYSVRITKYENVFSKAYTENWSREIFVIALVLKTNPWTYKIKALNEGKIMGSFCEKELLLSKL